MLLMWILVSHLYASGQRLVLPGDHPDPSVVKIGDTWWASATTSNWAPAYPLLKSKDLVHWEQQGYVFPKLPGWADYYFWAPEISYENGKVYVYYAAHKKGGNLCLGVASADRPEGPYRDHGTLMCQEVGSIDAFPMRDENGKLHMIWKEDANSVGKPTPIWIQEMNEERTALVGEKKELFRNNQPWERNLVEGVSMIRHGGWIYAFYAAAGCCGPGCTYVTGVARSRSLMGPWEKDPRNPVMTSNAAWVCPGHGTPVEKDGKYYFLYHAYDKETHAFTGREGLLSEFRFTADGWVEFVKDNNPAPAAPPAVNDDFRGRTLSDRWQWSVFQPVVKKQRRGRLHLSALPDASGAFLGTKTFAGDYTATAVVHGRKSGAAAGIGAIGDEKNTISAQLQEDNSVRVLQLREGRETEIGSWRIPAAKKVYLRMQVRNGKDISFFYSTDGRAFLALNAQPVNGAYLPPWDRAVRAGLIAKGPAAQQAVFESFVME